MAMKMPISPQRIGGAKRRAGERPESSGGDVVKVYPFANMPLIISQNRPRKVDISLMYFDFMEKFYKNLIKQYLGADFCNILKVIMSLSKERIDRGKRNCKAVA